MLDPQIG